MKLVSYFSENQERVGVVEGDHIINVDAVLEICVREDVADPEFNAAAGVVREDLSPAIDMIDLLVRGGEYLRALGVITRTLSQVFENKAYLNGLFKPLGASKLLAPITRPGKIACVGLNYADHAREQGREPPKAPIFFLKSGNTVCATGDPIVLPSNSNQVDCEAELAVVIGKGGKRIPVERAYEHVAGYMILNDVSARDLQYSDRQWFRGKSCDTFAPCGPWIVTRDEIGDPHNLHISQTLSGRAMQDSNTSNLIFQVDYLISYLSQSLTWEVGDVLSTGTPAGVGVFRKPPVFIKPSDTVSVTVQEIGTLTNPVVGPDGRGAIA